MLLEWQGLKINTSPTFGGWFHMHLLDAREPMPLQK